MMIQAREGMAGRLVTEQRRGGGPSTGTTKKDNDDGRYGIGPCHGLSLMDSERTKRIVASITKAALSMF